MFLSLYVFLFAPLQCDSCLFFSSPYCCFSSFFLLPYYVNSLPFHPLVTQIFLWFRCNGCLTSTTFDGDVAAYQQQGSCIGGWSVMVQVKACNGNVCCDSFRRKWKCNLVLQFVIVLIAPLIGFELLILSFYPCQNFNTNLCFASLFYFGHWFLIYGIRSLIDQFDP